MAYNRAVRFAGAEQFAVVPVSLSGLAIALKSNLASLNEVPIGLELVTAVKGNPEATPPTEDIPEHLIIDMAEVEQISPFELSVFLRKPDNFLRVPVDAVSIDFKNRRVLVNLEVPVGAVNNALTYNIATAQPA